MEWLEQQGPWCPALLDHLAGHWQSYDALIFFTYLYAPTVLGLQIDHGRSILVPTAHDEPAIHLGIYTEMFRRPKAIAFNTEVEKAFLKATFDIRRPPRKRLGAASICSRVTHTSPAAAGTASPKGRSSCTAAASTQAKAATSCSIFSIRTRNKAGRPRLC